MPNQNDPLLISQSQYLATIPKEHLQKLVQLFDNLKEQGNDESSVDNDSFHELHKMLYDLKLIFDFNWMDWHDGWKNIKSPGFDYSTSSLLELSMYLTAIFRADRFNEGTIKHYFRNGTLGKIMRNVDALMRCRRRP